MPNRSKFDRVRTHWLFRYGLAVVLFASVLVLSITLDRLSAKISMTIPIVFALVAAVWFGGRGPGLLIAALFHATTIIYTPVPPDSSIAKVAFGHFSVALLYVFLVYLISGLRITQARLSEQRDLLQVTLASIADGVITTDRDERITFMNPVAEGLTGWDNKSVRGQPLDEVFKIVDEDTRARAANPVARVLTSGSVVGLTNHTLLLARDGKETPIEDRAAPIRQGKDLKGAVLVFGDVTERKAAERMRREREIMHSIVEAQESERNRIARDLHDHLGQQMTALRLTIQKIAQEWSGNEQLTESLIDVQAAALRIDKDIGFLSWELRPTEMEELGLVDALASFVREWSKQYGIDAEFNADPGAAGDGPQRVSNVLETNLYRITQEALNNILKHAAARSVNVTLHRQGDNLVLAIEDDGRGFDTTAADEKTSTNGLGLLGMRERAALLKGTLEIESRPGGGTTLLVRLPLTAV